MKWTVDLPYYDKADGSLTPLVLAAKQAGATIRHHFTNPSLITVEFSTQAAATAFAAQVASIEGAVGEPSSVALVSDHSVISADADPGDVVSQLSQPYGSTTAYNTVGTVPPQLGLSGRNIVAGSSSAISGNSYSIKVRATNADNTRAIEEVFPFLGVAVGEVEGPEEPHVPAPSLSLSSAISHSEGNSGLTSYVWTLTLNRDGSTASFPYTWAVAGSGGNPADIYDFGGAFPTGSGTFATGETSKSITVTVSGDTAVEPNETFTLTVNASGLNTVTSTGTISNDDADPIPAPTLALSSAVTHSEGNSGTTSFNWTLTLNRDGSTSSFPYTWAITGSGANPADAADFGGTFPTGSGTFATGETSKSIIVLASGDTAVEPNETFTLTVTANGLSTVTSTGTINNDDVEPPAQTAPMVSIDASGWEADYASTPSISSPVSYTVSRQGFDAVGSSSTITETQYVTARVRQPYPNQATLTDQTVSLSDYVYASDTISGVTNNSTEQSPKAVANFVTIDQKVIGNSIGGTAVPVEICAFHRNGIAAVKFIISDGTNTVTVTVSSMTVSSSSTDRNAVLVYALPATNISTLSDQSVLTINAEIYPRIGVSASVLKSADSAVPREFSPRYFFKHTARATNPVYVYVNATTGVDATVGTNGAASAIQKVSTDPAVAAANPFLTFGGLNGAQRALKAATTLTGGVTSGCIIRVQGTVPLASGWTSDTYQNTNGGAMIIERDPNDATAQISFGTVAVNKRQPYTLFRDIALTRAGVQPIQLLLAENVTIDNAGHNSTLLSTYGLINGATITNAASSILSNSTHEARLLRGLDIAGSVISTQSINVVGNLFRAGASMKDLTTRIDSGGIIAFNRVLGITATQIIDVGSNGDVDGFALVQNEFEAIGTTQGPLILLSGDGRIGSTRNLIVWNNTAPGASSWWRCNWAYVDKGGDGSVGPSARTHKLWSVRGNITGQLNVKDDVFVGANQSDPTTAATATGGWSQEYSAGWLGNFIMHGDASGGTVGQGQSFSQEIVGRKSSYGASSSVANDPLFIDPKITTVTGGVATAGAGGSNLRLQSGSPALGVLAAGEEMLPFDLAGLARDRGSLGAYR